MTLIKRLAILCSLGCYALITSSAGITAERYTPVINVMDHMGPGALNFLAGNWKSIDPKQEFCESWTLSEDGLLTGVRKVGGPNAEYDIVAFIGNPTGAGVCMRRLTHSLRDTTDLIGGNWDATTTNRGVISFKTNSPKLEIVNTYDSPSDDRLNITIEETPLNGAPIKRTIMLSRVPTTK
jgi:hypothetical protein